MKLEHIALIGAGLLLLPKLAQSTSSMNPITDVTPNVVSPAPSSTPVYTLDYVTQQWERAKRTLVDARHYTDIERNFVEIRDAYKFSESPSTLEYQYQTALTQIEALKSYRYDLAQDVQYWYKQRQALL